MAFHAETFNGRWYKEGSNEHVVLSISVPW